jgi:hypothetical protein
VQFEGEPVGVAFAFANAALFTAYIVAAHRVAALGVERDRRLAAAMISPSSSCPSVLERRRAFLARLDRGRDRGRRDLVGHPVRSTSSPWPARSRDVRSSSRSYRRPRPSSASSCCSSALPVDLAGIAP